MKAPIKALLFLVLMPKGWGVIRHTIVPQEKSSFCVSNQDFTRIAVEGDRIKSIFGKFDGVHIEKDKDEGQIFIRPLSAATKGPVNFSVTTEEGIVHDVSLTFSPQPPEAILLIVKEEKKQAPSSALKGQKDVFNRLMGERLNDMLKYMKGYRDVMLAYDEKPELKGEARIIPFEGTCRLEFAWEKGRYRHLIYKVKNEGSSLLKLDERVFLRPLDKALYLSQRELKPSESAWLFIIQEKGIVHEH